MENTWYSIDFAAFILLANLGWLQHHTINLGKTFMLQFNICVSQPHVNVCIPMLLSPVTTIVTTMNEFIIIDTVKAIEI